MIFGDMPEDMKQVMEAQMERAEMAGTAFRHDIMRLIRSLPADDLMTFKSLMRHLQESTSSAFYLEGVAATTLEMKYDVCGGCGKNHDKDLLGDDPAPRDPEGGTEQLELFTMDGKVSRVDVPLPAPAERQSQMMAEYNLEETIDGIILCKGCGTASSSLEDRMLRPPGVRGCPGCQDKAKFG